MAKKLIVVAGAGSYPRHVIEGAKAAGVEEVVALAVRGSTARATWKAADSVHWVSLGGIADGIRWMAAQGADGAILAGQVNPLSLFRGRFDDEVKAWLAELDVKKYGVICSSRGRRGLLLPDLEGVDSVEQQLDIACSKGGFDRYAEDLKIERFEVIRHV